MRFVIRYPVAFDLLPPKLKLKFRSMYNTIRILPAFSVTILYSSRHKPSDLTLAVVYSLVAAVSSLGAGLRKDGFLLWHAADQVVCPSWSMHNID